MAFRYTYCIYIDYNVLWFIWNIKKIKKLTRSTIIENKKFLGFVNICKKSFTICDYPYICYINSYISLGYTKYVSKEKNLSATSTVGRTFKSDYKMVKWKMKLQLGRKMLAWLGSIANWNLCECVRIYVYVCLSVCVLCYAEMPNANAYWKFAISIALQSQSKLPSY